MTDASQFGVTCAASLREAKKANPTITWPEIAQVIQTHYDTMHALTLSAEPAHPRMSKKDLNGALFDALCESCGQTAKEMTRRAKATVGQALLEIRTATPDITPDEIHRRAKLYGQRHRDWPLTPSSLAGHWHEFGRGDKTETAKTNIYQEPAAWREILRERGLPGLSADVVMGLIEREWADIRVSFGAQILARIR